MTLTEILVFLSLSAVIALLPSKFNVLLKEKLNEAIENTQERHEVLHAIDLITRSIRQAGYISAEVDRKSNKRLRNDNRVGIQTKENAGLSNTHIGQFISRKSFHTANESDALTITHEINHHVDCLGHTLTESRLVNQRAFHGYFVQWMGTKSQGSGTLMCQSLNQRGQLQNDGILSGVNGFYVKPIYNSTQGSHQPSGVLVRLVMQSGQEYEQLIHARNNYNR